ncbi:MAG: FISUMP domain-containing protein [Bacteroidota bacterium]|nr:FISUMP domain-containing protein [Bacteroidota bacterium]
MKTGFLIALFFLSISVGIAQESGTLMIKANMQGAVVKLNGVTKGKTPCNLIVDAEIYDITATKNVSNTEKYFVKKTITLRKGEVKEIFLILENTVTDSEDATETDVTENKNKKEDKEEGKEEDKEEGKEEDKEEDSKEEEKAEYSMTDSRNNLKYKVVKIGTKWWMAENLNYKSGDDSWSYENSANNAGEYGKLYTWKEAKKVCPTGWHLPSSSEWNTAKNYISKLDIKMGGVYYYFVGSFSSIGETAGFWTSTSSDASNAVAKTFRKGSNLMKTEQQNKTYGYSVRCVKN